MASSAGILASNFDPPPCPVPAPPSPACGVMLQVIEVCTGANRNMRIMRARFSALIPRELQRAMQQLVAPNAADAAAVDARQEIDLRVGASFTRLQTLLLQVRLVQERHLHAAVR